MTTSIAKSLPRLYFWQMITVVFSMITQIYLARILGPHDKGILDLFLLIPTVLSAIVDFGLLSANTYFAGKKIFTLQSLHSNSIFWTIVAVIVLVIGGYGLQIIEKGPLTSLETNVFVLALLCAGPMLYVALWGGLMYGDNKAVTVYIVQGLGAVVQFMAYVVVVLSHGSLLDFLIVTALALAAKAGMAVWMYNSSYPIQFKPDQAVLKSSIRYGFALFVGIVVNILHNRTIQFFVEGYLGPAALGCYAIAVRMVEMIWLLDYVVINASLFKLTASSKEESILLTMRMTRTIGCIVTAAALAMAIAIPWLIPWLLTSQFSSSVAPALLLLPGIIGWSLGRSLAQFIGYQIGKPWYNTVAALAAFAINLGLGVIFVPRFGINGAAIATSLSYISLAVLMTVLFSRIAKVSILSIYRIQREDIILLKQSIRDIWLSLHKKHIKSS
jgi:O-antigen/teichoic acid export membrane protein